MAQPPERLRGDGGAGRLRARRVRAESVMDFRQVEDLLGKLILLFLQIAHPFLQGVHITGDFAQTFDPVLE